MDREKPNQMGELDERAQRLMEEKDAESRLRIFVGPMETVLTVLFIAFAVFEIYANLTGKLGAVKLRASHIMFLPPLCYILYPTYKREKRRRKSVPIWDYVLIAAAIGCFSYILWRYDAMA